MTRVVAFGRDTTFGVHYSFLVFLFIGTALFLFVSRLAGLVVLGVMASLALHELGHVLGAKLVGATVLSSTVGIAGGRTIWFGGDDRLTVAIVTLAGPAVNCLIAVGCTVLGGSLELLGYANLVIGIGNLVPLGRGSDGAILIALRRETR